MATFIQNHLILPAWIPVDINGAAQTGDVVNFELYNRITFMGINNNGTGAITYTPRESIDGSSAADLELIADHWELTHASSLVTAGLVYTHTARAVADDVVTTANQPAITVFDVTADQLSEGFNTYQVNAAESMGAACLTAAFYIFSEPRYSRDLLPAAT